MSTFSTSHEERRQRIAEQELQYLQSCIVRQRAEIITLATEIQILRDKEPFTQKEFSEKEIIIAFKMRQRNQMRSALNRLEARAHVIAQAFGLSQ